MSTKNLRPINLSHEEAVKNGRKGGKASAAARRQKKTLKETASVILNMPLSQEAKFRIMNSGISLAGLDDSDMDNRLLVICGLLAAAAEGNTSAAKMLFDMIDTEAAQKQQLELDRLKAVVKALQEQAGTSAVCDDQVIIYLPDNGRNPSQ